jgi:hypothetical protein
MLDMLRGVPITLLLLAGCVGLPPGEKVRRELKLPEPSANAPLYAGFDVLHNPPIELATGQPRSDDIDYDPFRRVVVRNVTWTVFESTLSLTCLMGQEDARSVVAKLASTLASMRIRPETLRRTDRMGDFSVEREDLFAWARGNVAIILSQRGESRFNLPSLAQAFDERILDRPGLSRDDFPDLKEVRFLQDIRRIPFGTTLQITLETEGERGFLHAGWMIHGGRSLTARYHVDTMTFVLIASRVGAFKLSVWVINRRQLATVRSFQLTVVEN